MASLRSIVLICFTWTIKCYLCNGQCSAVELLFMPPRPCPVNQYCLTSIVQRGGARKIFKRCVDRVTCEQEWYDQTSDKTVCQTYDGTSGAPQDLSCQFCCTTDACNPKAFKPADRTLYRP
ncbi:uncharacterized protein LOC118478107 [Aplysia californica]|uniref:Uncharacterized protein LOC118478107 n=1 Tax=Aplysia californica TaxID=6500 RepID=A0ABM1VX12_APLCA|nr:uncharacterized protein LOC118478107 [Aplysia californica]